ncbi:hypothetical protein BJX96DRAFT_160688 [Aspergillus floccosus]
MLRLSGLQTMESFIMICSDLVTVLRILLMWMRSLWPPTTQLRSLPADRQAGPRPGIYQMVVPWKHAMSAKYAITTWWIWH